MSATRLYCQGACALCAALGGSLAAAGVAVESYDVTADPAAYDAVLALGYRSLPVLVAADGTVAAGADAAVLARRLTRAAGDDGHSHALAARSALAAPTPVLHPALVALAPLLGEWNGTDHGSYPTVEAFDYVETLRFAHAGKPFLSYVQSTRRASDGTPLHVETGYLRPAGAARVELVVAQPTGIVEIDEGTFEHPADGVLRIRLRSRTVGLTSSAKQVTEVERSYHLDGGVLRTSLAMAAVGQPLTGHLASELRQTAPTSAPTPTTEEVAS